MNNDELTIQETRLIIDILKQEMDIKESSMLTSACLKMLEILVQKLEAEKGK